MMTRTNHRRLAVLLALSGLIGCSEEHPARLGTQIGFEDDGPACVEVSSEGLTDLSTVPEGFSESPQAILDRLTGSYSGAQLDEREQPTSDMAELVVADSGNEVVLRQYEPNDEETPDGPLQCGPTLTVDLDVTLTADGLPGFQGGLMATIYDDSRVWSQHEGEDGFDGPLPAPTEFDPDQVDVVAPTLYLSANGGTEVIWAYVNWEAEIDDGGGEDGGPTLLNELLMMASLDRQP